MLKGLHRPADMGLAPLKLVYSFKRGPGVSEDSRQPRRPKWVTSPMYFIHCPKHESNHFRRMCEGENVVVSTAQIGSHHGRTSSLKTEGIVLTAPFSKSLVEKCHFKAFHDEPLWNGKRQPWILTLYRCRLSHLLPGLPLDRLQRTSKSWDNWSSAISNTAWNN